MAVFQTIYPRLKEFGRGNTEDILNALSFRLQNLMTGAKLSEVHQLSSAQRRLLIEISKDQMMPLESGLSDSVMLALLIENTETLGQDVIEVF